MSDDAGESSEILAALEEQAGQLLAGLVKDGEILKNIRDGGPEMPIAYACAFFALLSATTGGLPPDLHGLVQSIGEKLVQKLVEQAEARPTEAK